MMKDKKRSRQLIAVMIAGILAVVLAFVLRDENIAQANHSMRAEQSIVNQKIVGMYEKPVPIVKVFYQDKLLGAVYDVTILDKAKDIAYNTNYRDYFANSDIKYNEDIYLYEEKTYMEYENKDDEIMNYLIDNDLFSVEAYQINIGDKDVIYVRSNEEFKNALRTFVMSFIDEETFLKLERNETIPPLSEYGEKDMNIYIEETIKSTKVVASSKEIFKSEAEIIRYLAYGRDPQLEYYTVQHLDTIQGIASKHNLSAEQLVIINDDIRSENQALKEGSQLNITYYDPVITIVVERDRLVQETILQPQTEYVNDPNIAAGNVVVAQEGWDGSKDVLYREVYVNGVITSYKQVSSTVTREAQRKIIHIGAGSIYIDTGDKSFTFPVENPVVICDYYCYAGHSGIDIQNRYNHYSPLYAAESGVITGNGWWWDMGWYYIIDHGNGIIVRYLHMRIQGPLPVGTEVVKGQYIGEVGMTGQADCPHVHVDVRINGVRVDPCSIFPC